MSACLLEESILDPVALQGQGCSAAGTDRHTDHVTRTGLDERASMSAL